MRTIGELLRLHAKRTPKKEALVGQDGRLTYGELAERAWGKARGLRDLGIEPGDRVGVLGTNSLFNSEMFFTVAVSGGVYVAYNWRWTAAELAEGVAETGAKVILVEEQFRTVLSEALEILATTLDILPAVIYEGQSANALQTGQGPIEEVVNLDSPLVILYTGGSTGTPKGVVLSQRAAMANAFNEIVDARLGSRPHERGLIVTPLFHAAGIMCWLISHFVAGATSVLAPKFDAETLVELVEKEHITNTFMIPNMMRSMMDQGVFHDKVFQKHLKAVHTGAGLLKMPDKQMFIEILPEAELYFRYGLTEAGPMVTRLRHEDMLDPTVDGSIGQEYFLVETELLNPEGRPVGIGELGEICVKSPSTMMEYFGRPEETKMALRHGWLHTGDLATRDERGYLFFRDRIKEMIKSGGENVYAAEVEQALYGHPGVLEAAVVGVPNKQWGEEVRAVIVLRSGAQVSEAELKTHMRATLAGYKVPKQMVFLQSEELPRSAAGKLVKANLKANLGWDS